MEFLFLGIYPHMKMGIWYLPPNNLEAMRRTGKGCGFSKIRFELITVEAGGRNLRLYDTILPFHICNFLRKKKSLKKKCKLVLKYPYIPHC